MNNTISYKKIGIVIGILVVITVILIFTVNTLRISQQSPSQRSQTNTIPTTFLVNQQTTPGVPPSLIPGNSESYKKSVQIIAVTEAPILEREKAVGKLKFKTPYQGIHFQMNYDYKRLQYIVTIPNDKIVEGNTEFDTFLKQNDIADRSWIRKELLVIRYE